MRFFFWSVSSARMPRSSSSLTAALAVGNVVSRRGVATPPAPRHYPRPPAPRPARRARPTSARHRGRPRPDLRRRSWCAALQPGQDLRRAQAVNHGIARHVERPGARVVQIAEGGSLPHGFHEDVLQHVVGGLGMGHAVTQVAAQFGFVCLPGAGHARECTGRAAAAPVPGRGAIQGRISCHSRCGVRSRMMRRALRSPPRLPMSPARRPAWWRG